jgi:hypothetical protein
MLRFARILGAAAVAVCVVLAAALADVPQIVNYQGRLTTPAGSAVADGPYLIQFRIYDAAIGGTVLWDNAYRTVIVTDGLFSYSLGDSVALPSNLFEDTARWLGIKVGVDSEIAPRTKLISVPYAYQALRVDSAQYASEAAGVLPGSIGATEISSSEVQLRVEETCPSGYYISQINEDGSVVCIKDSLGGGVTDHGELSGLGDDDHPQYLHTTIDDTVFSKITFGDSTMKICSDRVIIGNNNCSEGGTALLLVKRDVDLGDLKGIVSDVETDNAAATGVYGKAEVSSAGASVGVQGRAIGGSSAYGIVGDAYNASNDNYAGKFYSDVDIDGTLSKSGGSFRIDHPLDPENKYLQHSFVESPDMMNIYNGNAVLDAEGRAVVELPEYFGALNREFRYQLTCIGGYAPVYISEEISGNVFAIAGGVPSMKVSWQVTGVRHDKWSEANRIQVEVEKRPDERGLYRHPELYGFGIEKHVDHDLLKDIREESAK